jgi:hypothetical protein
LGDIHGHEVQLNLQKHLESPSVFHIALAIISGRVVFLRYVFARGIRFKVTIHQNKVNDLVDIIRSKSRIAF